MQNESEKIRLEDKPFEKLLKAQNEREKLNWENRKKFYLILFPDGTATPLYNKQENIPQGMKIYISLTKAIIRTNNQKPLTSAFSNIPDLNSYTQQ